MMVIDHRHKAHALLQQDDAVFAVNILGRDQQHLSHRFAWINDEDRFDEGEWDVAVTGAPILSDALAWLDCTITASFPAGTHQIYVGEVQACGVPKPDGSPLIYWNRDYRHLDLDNGN
jgi:flavin reductase (DIM6/NTAB) family NADH-FMN oxidoreductase RutF